MFDRESRSVKKLKAEFLPEALEIVEKPNAPLGNLIIWLIFLVIGAFVLWACIGKLDEVATARGQLVSVEGTQQIQASESGIITSVHVKEGDTVHKGDVLYTMDKELDKINIEYSEDQIGLTELRVELLDRMLAQKDLAVYREQNVSPQQREVIDSMIALNEQDGISVKEYETAAEAAKNQYETAQEGLDLYAKRQEYLGSEKELQSDGQKLGSAQEIEVQRLKESYEYLEKEADKYERLYEAGAKTRAEWEAKVQERDNAKAQLEIKEIELGKQSLSDYSEELSLDYQVSEADSDYENQVKTIELAKSNYDTALLNLEHAKAQRKNKLLEMKEQYVKELKQHGVTVRQLYYEYENKDIVALYDGVVKEVYIDKAGAVVCPTQVVAEILPDTDQLIVEAEIKNNDIGFVEVGQNADVKIDTYDYQKYGKLNGTVLYISPDAIENEQREKIYKANILLDGIHAENMEISTGMQCSIEVKTDQKRVIAFFLEPLAEALDNSLNVR
ncbi:MAG: HlyD family efflux transporter periplasmic adaptor subunit [Lachnospiraceae bacterium]|nr:HlyD family efflux transporter periplasmic adaptor subunit [Lachnospiraceae bacterium]